GNERRHTPLPFVAPGTYGFKLGATSGYARVWSRPSKPGSPSCWCRDCLDRCTHREAHWRDVTADGAIDVGLLQEAVPPPAAAVHETVPALSERWVTAGADRRFCAVIARLSDRVSLRPSRRTAGRHEPP